MKNMKENKKNMPLISVVMPVYNGGFFVTEAIESILSQTYTNFEFIIIDDASEDDTWAILSKYAQKDHRVTILRNVKNMGVSEAVKRAIKQAKGEFIARMDADDISLPKRFEKQVSYLLKHPETVALGGQCYLIDADGTPIGTKTFPTEHNDIHSYIFSFIPIQQPTLMIARKRLPHDFSFYKDGLNTAEEVELIFKLFQYGKVENLPDFVLKYRMHSDNTSFRDVKRTFLYTLISRLTSVVQYGYKPSLLHICITFLQTLVVLMLPQKAIMFIYSYMRHVKVQYSKKKYSKLEKVQFETI